MSDRDVSCVSDEASRHVVRGEAYRGYVTPYAGCGTVIFRSPEGEDIRFYCRDDEWIDAVWLQAKGEIDRRLDRA